MPADAKDYVIRILEDPADIDAGPWNRLLASQDLPTPFMRHEYLLALHRSASAVPRTGWLPRCFVIEGAQGLQAACVLYVKSHSRGEYVFDWAWADAYRQHGLRYYPKGLIACPFTPVPGSKLLATSEATRAALVRALLAWCSEQELSSLHLLFCSPADQRACEAAGLMPRHTVQFHWHNAVPAHVDFDHFLAALTQDKRKKIRQERRKVAQAGVSFRWRRGSDITREDWDFFYACYERTYLEHGNAPYLTRDFFEQMACNMPQHWLLFIAERAGADGRPQPIASSLIALSDGLDPDGRGDKVAYGRYWGALERVDCLHFEACYYQPLQWCIAHGYRRFEGGAQGEHKMARALMPVRTTSAHWLAHPAFADAVDRFLQRESQGMGEYVDELAQHSPFRQGD